MKKLPVRSPEELSALADESMITDLELANLLNISPRTLMRLRGSGRLPSAIKVGSRQNRTTMGVVRKIVNGEWCNEVV